MSARHCADSLRCSLPLLPLMPGHSPPKVCCHRPRQAVTRASPGLAACCPRPALPTLDPACFSILVSYCFSPHALTSNQIGSLTLENVYLIYSGLCFLFMLFLYWDFNLFLIFCLSNSKPNIDAISCDTLGTGNPSCEQLASHLALSWLVHLCSLLNYIANLSSLWILGKFSTKNLFGRVSSFLTLFWEN